MTITTIVCAYNESQLLPACLFSLLAQTRPPDEIIVVNNASTDGTGSGGAGDPGRHGDRRAAARGWWWRGKPAAGTRTGDVLAYIDADCRVPLQWLERVERRFLTRDGLVAVTGPYRFYDWDWAAGC